MLEELFNFFKKRGFWDTFQVLSQCKNNRTDTHSFYQKLNQFSYYNSFLRIKSKLIERGFIAIERKNQEKIIRLTKKGKMILDKLFELDIFMKS